MSNEQRREYVLTDGSDQHGDIRAMTPSELEAANEEAKGTFSWIPYDSATMGRFLQPQSD